MAEDGVWLEGGEVIWMRGREEFGRKRLLRFYGLAMDFVFCEIGIDLFVGIDWERSYWYGLWWENLWLIFSIFGNK